jgi:hypothetical protein
VAWKEDQLQGAVAAFMEKEHRGGSCLHVLRNFLWELRDQSSHRQGLKKLGHTIGEIKGFVILPNSPLHHGWNSLVVYLLLAVCVILPFDWAFQPYTQPTPLLLPIGIELFFIADFVLQFHTAYHDVGDHIATSRAQIASNYFNTYMLLDFTASIPIESFRLVGVLSGSLPLYSSFNYLSACKALRCFRLLRWWRNNPQLCVDYWSLLRLLAAFVLVTHVLACMW